jgi:hypothetical protein
VGASLSIPSFATLSNKLQQIRFDSVALIQAHPLTSEVVREQMEGIVARSFPRLGVARVSGQDHYDYLEYCIYYSQWVGEKLSSDPKLYLIVSPDGVQLRRSISVQINGRLSEIDVEVVVSENGAVIRLDRPGIQNAILPPGTVLPASAVRPDVLNNLAASLFTFDGHKTWKLWFAEQRKQRSLHWLAYGLVAVIGIGGSAAPFLIKGLRQTGGQVSRSQPPAADVARDARSCLTVEDYTQVNVVEIQSLLRELGYDVTVDGVIGPQTRRAIEQYERLVNLPPTGTMTVGLLELLRKDTRRC